MTFGDRLFWGIMCFVGIVLFWVGLLPASAPAIIGIALGVVCCVLLVLFGPRPKSEISEEQG